MDSSSGSAATAILPSRVRISVSNVESVQDFKVDFWYEGVEIQCLPKLELSDDFVADQDSRYDFLTYVKPCHPFLTTISKMNIFSELPSHAEQGRLYTLFSWMKY